MQIYVDLLERKSEFLVVWKTLKSQFFFWEHHTCNFFGKILDQTKFELELEDSLGFKITLTTHPNVKSKPS